MCHQYQDNRYPVLWIPHLIMIITTLIGLFRMKVAICKKFIGFTLIIFYSFWLVSDVMCYTPIITSVMALFFGMYISILILSGVFDGLLVYCKCWGQEEQILDKLIREVENEDLENNYAQGS